MSTWTLVSALRRSRAPVLVPLRLYLVPVPVARLGLRQTRGLVNLSEVCMGFGVFVPFAECLRCCPLTLVRERVQSGSIVLRGQKL